MSFVPARLLVGAHRQTIASALAASPAVEGASVVRHVPIGSGAAMRMAVTQPEGRPRGTILLAHGLAGSAESPYIRWTASEALARDWCVARLDLRGCGGTERLSRGLHTAADGEDITRALAALEAARQPRPHAAVGFSLGANLVLREAGLRGETFAADAAVGVSPPVDLVACSRALSRARNVVYRLYFLRRLFELVRRARQHVDIPGPIPSLLRVPSVWRFDDVYTAPAGGWDSAEAYYRDASCGRYLEGIQRPTLILAAKDDPFIPFETVEACHASAPECIRFLHPVRGGHVGFWQAGRPRFWAAQAALDFLDEVGPREVEPKRRTDPDLLR